MASNVKDLLSHNLQCPICLNVFTDPRLLACSHTYCKDCLIRLFNSQKDRKKIGCPVCHKTTAVPKGDIANLQANQPIKALIEDVKNQSQMCTVCNGEEKPLAITYCQDCDDYMCVDCHKKHDKWDKFTGHDVVKVDDILTGKISKKKRRKCKKHASEDEECFCVECKRYVCFRCGMMEHGRAGHNVLDGKEHEDGQKEKIKELQGRADGEKSKLDAYMVYVEEQQAKLKLVMDGLSREIEQTCEESIQQLRERRDELIKECQRRIDELSGELQGMKLASRMQIGQINDVRELVGSGLKMPLEGEALAAHDTMCQDLEGILGRSDPDYDQPQATATRGQHITFQRIRGTLEGQDKLDLGEILDAMWHLGKAVPFPVKDGVNCIASTPNGKLAAGSRFGGLTLCNLDGKHEVVLKGVAIRGIAFLSDGRVAIRDIYNNISLYSKSFTKLDVEFNTPSHDEGGFGSLAVNQEENNVLIVSFLKLKKIFVYGLNGGKPLKKISCSFKPTQVFGLRSSTILAVAGESTVVVLDVAGKVQQRLLQEGTLAQPAVCMDGTILVAWVKHEEGLVTIEQYSRDLEHLRTLVTNLKFTVPQHSWYHLREFASGELAFCTPDNLYIFQRSSTEPMM